MSRGIHGLTGITRGMQLYVVTTVATAIVAPFVETLPTGIMAVIHCRKYQEVQDEERATYGHRHAKSRRVREILFQMTYSP